MKLFNFKKENKVNKLKILAVRHGEVLLLPVNKVLKGKTTQHKEFIVGHSETGHHHVLKSKTEFTVQDIDKAMVYLQLFEPATLSHQKTVNRHKDLVIPAGTYKVVHKQEYDPFAKIMRAVWD